ncbi:MAG: tyrosine-protein phosphatase [Synergistaceae bacterium]|nr:tyrosine-protein phosphatase [Synergistaceae bacterium]
MRNCNIRKSLAIVLAVVFALMFWSRSEAAAVNKKNFYRSLASRLSKNRDDYKNLSDYEFANFRAVRSTGIKPGKLYRSSSPVKPWGNRNLIADSAAMRSGVKTFINLADDYKYLNGYKSFASSYYATQKIICLNLDLKFKSKNFQSGVARGVSFMAKNSPPYLVHCDLGKDRCGIFCAIVESLAGASSSEIVADYMISFRNYFGINPGTEDYEFVADNEIRPFLASIFEVKSIEGINLAAAAEQYLMRIGVSRDDIQTLRQKLSNP